MDSNEIDTLSAASLDPYYVSNSDNPALSLTQVVFNGTNFVRWSRNIKKALGAKNKIGFIDGSILKPEEGHKDLVKWQRADYLVGCWLTSSMSNEIAEDFSYAETALELWTDVTERFGQANGPLILQLKREISNLKQENSTILSYYGKIKRLWDDLKSVKKCPKCSCGALSKCTCNFLKQIADEEQGEKLMQFLLGLNNGFEHTVTNLISQDPLPPLNKALSIVQQVEKQKEVCGTNIQLIPIHSNYRKSLHSTP